MRLMVKARKGYTDGLGRTWRWNEGMKKYEYVRKDGSTASGHKAKPAAIGQTKVAVDQSRLLLNKKRKDEIEEKYKYWIKSAEQRVESVRQSFSRRFKAASISQKRRMRLHSEPNFKSALSYLDKQRRDKQKALKGAGKLAGIIKGMDLGLQTSTSRSTAIRGYRVYTKGFNIMSTENTVVIDFTTVSDDKIKSIQAGLKKEGYATEINAAGNLEVTAYNPYLKGLSKAYKFSELKKHRIALTKEERAECLKKGAVWHFGPGGKESPAVWKARDSSGSFVYGTNTHRAFGVAKSLAGAIRKFAFIKTTS